LSTEEERRWEEEEEEEERITIRDVGENRAPAVSRHLSADRRVLLPEEANRSSSSFAADESSLPRLGNT
jgi:hypothetical protein